MYLTNHTELFNAYLNMSVMKPLQLIKKTPDVECIQPYYLLGVSISQISIEVGFETLASFPKAFKLDFRVCYFLDPERHIITFAEKING